MEYNKTFIDFLHICQKNDEYVGLGNPNAKILFIGKEAGVKIDEKVTHGGAESWLDNNDYSLPFVPTESNIRNGNHTWQKYQKLYELILKGIKIDFSKKDNKEITFVENVFTTELNNLHAPTTKEAKKRNDFTAKLEKRKNIVLKSDFIQNFPIVLILADDNDYIETYQGEVCETFGVKFIDKIEFNKNTNLWYHHSRNDNPKLVIHTRQLTGAPHPKLIETIAKKIVEFINENDIEIMVKR